MNPHQIERIKRIMLKEALVAAEREPRTCQMCRKPLIGWQHCQECLRRKIEKRDTP
jgi:hypothetical protein